MGVLPALRMNLRIPVYSPNISTEKLIDLLAANLNQERSIVDFERLETGVKFRTPDMAIVINSEASNIEGQALLVMVFRYLLKAAQILGATQFSIEHEGFDMRLRPTNLDGQHIENLIIASNTFSIDQINLF